MENIKLACSEVYCILELLGDSYKNKLPKKLLEFINQNRNENYYLTINNENYENFNISKDALVFISFLNLKYWVEDEEEKQRLIEIYKKNDEKRKEELNNYKNPNWLSKTKEENTNTEEQGKELIEIKKDTIFDKIKNIIKKFFYKKKE